MKVKDIILVIILILIVSYAAFMGAFWGFPITLTYDEQ